MTEQRSADDQLIVMFTLENGVRVTANLKEAKPTVAAKVLADLRKALKEIDSK